MYKPGPKSTKTTKYGRQRRRGRAQSVPHLLSLSGLHKRHIFIFIYLFIEQHRTHNDVQIDHGLPQRQQVQKVNNRRLLSRWMDDLGTTIKMRSGEVVEPPR